MEVFREELTRSLQQYCTKRVKEMMRKVDEQTLLHAEELWLSNNLSYDLHIGIRRKREEPTPAVVFKKNFLLEQNSAEHQCPKP